MNQLTFTDIEYSNRRKVTKREEFLNGMDEIIPWQDWVNIIKPYYYNNKRGRKPIAIETMLRMYLMQIWFSLSDEGIEDSIYDSYAMRSFMHLDFTEQQVPDATTLLHFRHLLEKHKIGEKIFNDINDRLDAAGMIMHGGTIVDATLISAPSSTKNKDGKRDPEMHQTKKGNQWYFGMKVHSGVDAGTGYVHTITGTSASVHDIDQAKHLIRPDDDVVYGDSGYRGIEKRPEIQQDEHPFLIVKRFFGYSKVSYRIALRPSQLKTSPTYTGINWDRKIEHDKSSVRCKVEHPFLIVKRFFGYSKVSYRGIEKNMNRFHMLFGSANLLMCNRAGRAREFLCSVV